MIPLRRRGLGRWAAVPVAIILYVITGIGVAPAIASNAPGSVDPLVGCSEDGFLEVRDNGQLWYYGWNGSGFDGYLADGGGWGQTKLVALMGCVVETGGSRFVEVKGDALRSWHLNRTNNGYSVTFLETVDTGWSNTRILTGVGNVAGDGGHDFVQVRDNGDLMLYRSQGNGYAFERWLDNGYENARLIAGNRNHRAIYLINDLNDLWTYSIYADRKPTGEFVMSGWSNVRLLGPGGMDPRRTWYSFVSVRYNGQLVQWEWDWNVGGFTPAYTDTNWFNARLIG